MHMEDYIALALTTSKQLGYYILTSISSCSNISTVAQGLSANLTVLHDRYVIRLPVYVEIPMRLLLLIKP